MTATNPHPLANPYNTRHYCNFNVGLAMQQKYIRPCKNPKDLAVPQSRYSAQDIIDRQKQLTVPHINEVPYGAEYRGPNYAQNTNHFPLADGSIIDISTGKVIYDPNAMHKQNGYWADPNEQHKQSTSDMCWDETPSIESILSNVDKYKDGYDPNMSEYDMWYQQKCRDESIKLQQNMNDEQQTLLNQLNNGELFKLSRLEDV